MIQYSDNGTPGQFFRSYTDGQVSDLLRLVAGAENQDVGLALIANVRPIGLVHEGFDNLRCMVGAIRQTLVLLDITLIIKPVGMFLRVAFSGVSSTVDQGFQPNFAQQKAAVELRNTLWGFSSFSVFR